MRQSGTKWDKLRQSEAKGGNWGNFRQIKKEKKTKLSTTYSTATLPFSPSSMYVASNSNSLRRSWLPSSSRWVHEEKGRVYGAEITLCTWFYYHLNDFFLTTEMFVLDKRDEGCKGVASKSVLHGGVRSVPCFRGCQKNSVQNVRDALQYSKCLGGDPHPTPFLTPWMQ